MTKLTIDIINNYKYWKVIEKNMKTTKYILGYLKIILLLLPFLCSVGYLNAELEKGKMLKYDVTFGAILKGYAEIKFYGKVASHTDYDTIMVPYDSIPFNSSLILTPDSILEKFAADSIEEFTPDSTVESPQDSISNTIQDSVKILNPITTDIFFITYDTEFFGNLYSLYANIYTRDDFYPLLIETEIKRTGKLSKGLEQFFPDDKMAIFSQVIEGKKEVDTLRRNHPLQDVTTLPFYFKDKNIHIGKLFALSLPQGEYTLKCTKSEDLEFGEGFNYRYYKTNYIESNPEGFYVWLNKKNNIPIKVIIDSQKIKMVLKEEKTDKSIKNKSHNGEEVLKKLNHLFCN